MSYQITLECLVLDVEITHFLDVPGNPRCDASDWDRYGYCEIDSRTVGGKEWTGDHWRNLAPAEFDQLGQLHAEAIDEQLLELVNRREAA